ELLPKFVLPKVDHSLNGLRVFAFIDQLSNTGRQEFRTLDRVSGLLGSREGRFSAVESEHSVFRNDSLGHRGQIAQDRGAYFRSLHDDVESCVKHGPVLTAIEPQPVDVAPQFLNEEKTECCLDRVWLGALFERECLSI